MDLNGIAIAQRRSDNQMRFDQGALERAILRKGRRRAAVRADLVAVVGAWRGMSKMAVLRRP